MDELQKEITEWANATFGYNGTSSIVSSLCHLEDEVRELRQAVEQSASKEEVLKEYADCLIILLHTARSLGFSVPALETGVRFKFLINTLREWGEPDEPDVVKHIEK